MTITLKYFGIIAEEMGRSEEIVAFEERDLNLASIKDRAGRLSNSVRQGNFQIAVNRQVLADATIRDGDEIALLPPFSGG